MITIAFILLGYIGLVATCGWYGLAAVLLHVGLLLLITAIKPSEPKK